MPQLALAYVDPGTGSFVIQGIMAAVVGVAVAVKMFWHRIKKALGMKVLLNDPPRERKEGGDAFVSLEKLKEESDIITLHVPLNQGGTDNTHHLVNAEFVHSLKGRAILINSSRGAVVDEVALLEGIRSERFSDVVLDVFQNEPHINRDLMEAISLASPHIAGYSLDGKANGTTMSVRAVSRFFGLSLDQWSPASIPAPDPAEILSDAADSELQELLWDVFSQTYDVSSDDHRLRSNPENFEILRGDYPFRREPTAFAVRLFQGYPELRVMLEKLGFDVLSDQCM